MPNKILDGDQLQIRLNPKELELKTRSEWGKLYIGKQTEKARMFFSASAFSVASLLSFVAAVEFMSIFIVLAIVLGFLALYSFFSYGYRKGAINSWESKTMVRMDL